MFAAEARGDVPEGTAHRWAKHTKSIKKLPEYKGEKGGNPLKRWAASKGSDSASSDSASSSASS